MTTSIPLKIDDFDSKLDKDDLILIGDSLIDQKGLISHHLESANNFYKNGIKQIITEGFKTERELINKRDASDEDKEIERIFCKVTYTDVQLRPPTMMQFLTSKETLLYPKVALTREQTYSGSLLISCEIKATAYLKDGTTRERVDQSVKSFKICSLPIIKGSIMCNTYNKSKEALVQMGEDPMDPGGYFIVKGGEWAVDCTENMLFNQAKIYINEGYGKSRVRCEYMSKPGDTYQNSDYTLIRFSRDDTITIEIARNEMNEVQIPFFIIFRALGWNSDKDMIDWIVLDYENDANKAIFNYTVNGINANYGNKQYRDAYDSYECLKLIVDSIPEEKIAYYKLKENPDNMHNATNLVLKIFDTHCLPHIGMTPASRHEKLKFLALLIRKTLQVYLRYIPQTDRDSYRNKRIHAAGSNYAKSFKTYFNQAVVLPIKRRIFKDFNSASFSQVNLANMVKSAIYADDFERLIVQTITSGNRAQLKMKKKSIVNRLNTQLLNRKNQLNVLATMRQVSATSADSAKQSERASEMRRVHMSSIGYICVVHSPTEGERVGINKQLAIFTTIAPTSSSEIIKQKIREDEMIIPEVKLTPEMIFRGNYARVFVNGFLLGYCKDSIDLINKYRKHRRQLEINPHTTIFWDNTQNEVHFFVDDGRLTRPLMIVYNTHRDKEYFNKDTTSYKQGVAVTADDILALYEKRKTVDDLLREQKIEFITPEEQENCYICPNYEQLQKDVNNRLKQYTHCDIPQAMLGITALTSPFANHNAAPRITYQTSQAKQTCGYYSLNWASRSDKETFLQYINESPLIRTMANKYIFPNGCNIMMAIMCYTGYNVEDGQIFNKAAIDRGLFDGSKFTFVKTEFEQKEELGAPDASKTDGLKSANYEKLVDGIVQKGQLIQNEDVLIGKYMPLPKGTSDKYLYTDRSIVYKETEPAVVRFTIYDRDNDDNKFAKVALRKPRPTAVGDKFCLLPTAEVLTTVGWVQIKDITNEHSVAILDGNTLNYSMNNDIHIFDYDSKTDGKLYQFKGAGWESITTPDHKNIVNGDFLKAKDCRVGMKIKRTAKNNNRDKKVRNTIIDEEKLKYPISLYLKTLASTIKNGNDNIPCDLLMLGKNNFRTLVEELLSFDTDKRIESYIQWFLLHCGDEKMIREIRNVNSDYFDTEIKSIARLDYKGKVMCLETLTGNFYYRENADSLPLWTGNSSRSGQKGIVCALLREADMPFTEEGLRPAILFNPHGLPSRMTETPMIEALMGNLCAIKGAHADATMFKQNDIESIAQQLEECGMNRYGYERMISGITGEYIDTMVFFGPNFYQRLQKFIIDAEYAVRHALTDAVTMQCLDGAGSQGGLRIGEMERDVLAGHGASLFIHEKFYKHSDGYTEYICRCGKPAIVNHHENLYKCKECKDNADIVAIPSSWSSKLFMQEMESCNVGIRRIPIPFTYEKYDDANRTLSTIDAYDETTVHQLTKIAEEMIDDTGQAEHD